jgi:hypothetical protein
VYDFQRRALRVAAVAIVALAFVIAALVIWAIGSGPDCVNVIDYCDAAV